MREIISPKRKESAPAKIAGDLEINTWGKEYENWPWNEEIWELANPNTPTHESGTTDDATLFVAGEYIPEEILPGEAETEKEGQMTERKTTENRNGKARNTRPHGPKSDTADNQARHPFGLLKIQR